MASPRDRAWESLKRDGMLPSQPVVTLYSKPGCHLCEDARQMLDTLRPKYPHYLEVIDITSDAEAFSRFASRIPVVVAGSQEYGAPLDRPALERVLRLLK